MQLPILVEFDETLQEMSSLLTVCYTEPARWLKINPATQKKFPTIVKFNM